jgi:hypothetical protein
MSPRTATPPQRGLAVDRQVHSLVVAGGREDGHGLAGGGRRGERGLTADGRAHTVCLQSFLLYIEYVALSF